MLIHQDSNNKPNGETMATTDVNIYNVFISHNWNNSEHIHKITEQMDRISDLDPQFEYVNQGEFGKTSFESFSEEDLRITYREQIENSDIVLLLTDLYDEAKEWMDYAIECARELDVPVLAIRSFNNKEVPPELSENANEVVFYYTEEVMKVIKKYS